MSDDGNVLPQAEIDALFKQATGRNVAGSTATKTARQPEPAPPKPVAQAQVPSPSMGKSVPAAASETQSPAPSQPKPVDDGTFKTIMATLETLTKRIESIESSIAGMDRIEKNATVISVQTEKLSREIENGKNDIHKLSTRLTGILKGIKDTPGYGVRSSFTCGECGSHGTLAMPMKCSSCGKEGWLGWWPES